jgi:hypothetical protein
MSPGPSTRVPGEPSGVPKPFASVRASRDPEAHPLASIA